MLKYRKRPNKSLVPISSITFRYLLIVVFNAADAKKKSEVPMLCVVLKRQTPKLCSIYITFWMPTMVNIFPLEARDTDVFILIIYHVSNHTTSSTVWMDFGLSSNNTRRYIDISQLVDHLPQDLIDALPALHVFTGSDYAASMMNKGKLKYGS